MNWECLRCLLLGFHSNEKLEKLGGGETQQWYPALVQEI